MCRNPKCRTPEASRWVGKNHPDGPLCSACYQAEKKKDPTPRQERNTEPLVCVCVCVCVCVRECVHGVVYVAQSGNKQTTARELSACETCDARELRTRRRTEH